MSEIKATYLKGTALKPNFGRGQNGWMRPHCSPIDFRGRSAMMTPSRTMKLQASAS